MKRWDSMSKIFTKIGREISIAVKASGPDPDTNPRLRIAMQNAKSANMPKDNVERAIKKASDKDEANYKEMVYEGYAPHGVAVLVETATDNATRTVANVRSYFNKCNGSLGTSGSVEFLFERKAIFKVTGENVDMDELELEMIDFGGEEIERDDEDNSLIITGEFQDFGTLQGFLEGKGLEVINASTERFPMETKEIAEEDKKDIEKLLDKLEDDDDVQKVFHTMN